MGEATIFATREALMAAAAEKIAEALERGISERGEACAALSGGETPEPAYALLARKPLDWPHVTFALVDERFVPPTHADSNEAMLRHALAPGIEKGARLLPMYAPAANAGDAAARADLLYASLTFDIAVMGMGADGHTASWFEGACGLAAALDGETTRTVTALYATRAAGAVDRLSLTRSALARAGRIVLLIVGEDRRSRLEAALDGRAPAPVSQLWRPPLHGADVLWAP